MHTSLLSLLSDAVQGHADRVAVADARESLTYRELDRRSDALARQLREQGVGSGTFVGLMTGRSIHLIVGMLGILKSGGAYLPLDPDYPVARLAENVQDACVRCVVADSALRADAAALDDRVTVIPIPTSFVGRRRKLAEPGVNGSTPAYLLYTSGSTGKPKGVVVTHGNVLGLLNAMREIVPVTADDVVSCTHSFTFDFSVYEMWAALSTGAKLWLPDLDTVRSPLDFHAQLRQAAVTILSQTPTAFRNLLLADTQKPAPPALSSLRYVLFGGERLDFPLLTAWVNRYGYDRPQLVNLLGPTETTVHAVGYTLSHRDAGESRSIIGTALPGVDAQIVDADLDLVPDGAEGELVLSGWGVAKGYLNRPDLTAERFRSLPFDRAANRRWYRTGDLVRRLPDGRLEFLGRADGQVKLRGHRIELGEIEARLREFDGLQDGVVLLEAETSEDAHLVAYCVMAGGYGSLDPRLLAQHLSRRLPGFMCPSRYVAIESLPRTVNGKLDRAALRLLTPDKPPEERAGDACSERLRALFCRLLHRSDVAIHDNFFEIGGHSLLGVRLTLAIEREFGHRVSFRDLLDTPTVAGLAARLRASVMDGVEQQRPQDDADTVLARIRRYVAAAPARIALRVRGSSLGYAALDAESDRLARVFLAHGVVRGSRVANALPRSAEWVAALLATWKCAAVHVPLDPTQPRERRQAILNDAAPALLVLTSGDPLADDSHPYPVVDIAAPRPVDADRERSGVATEPDREGVAYMLYTSGTTGTPNGVELTHHTLLNLLGGHPMPERPGVVLQWAAVGFDVSLQEVCCALTSGSTLVLCSEEERRDPQHLLSLLARESVTDLFLPNAPLVLMAQAALDAHVTLPALQRVFQAGEALTITPAVRSFFERHGGCRLVNQYGPTETHVALQYALEGAPRDWPLRPPIGLPLPKMRMEVRSAAGRRVRPGKVGELWLFGSAVGLGYRQRPEKTAQKFGVRNGERYYRTGDQVIERDDGVVEFVGRADREVKIRGYRLSLGDLEAELLTYPAVRQCVVKVDGSGTQSTLIAYVVWGSSTGPNERALREYLASRVVAAGVPAQFIFLPALPITRHGKLDERALPSPAAPTLAHDQLPRDELEERVAQAYREILRRTPIGRDENFFELGGHSLAAAQLVSHLSRLTSRRVSLQDVLKAPTIATMAQRLLARPLVAAPQQAPARQGTRHPASAGQTRLWVLDQALALASAYNVLDARDLTGTLDGPRLQMAVERLIEQHAMLRTLYVWEGDALWQEIRASLPAIWQWQDCRDLSPAERADAATAAMAEELARPFDLSQGPILRVRVIRFAPVVHRIILALPHIAIDGWSMELLWRDLGTLYQGRDPRQQPGRETVWTYLDFVDYERAQANTHSAALAYWREALAGLPQLELPTDRSRGTTPSRQGAAVDFTIDGARLKALRRLVGQRRTTLHMALIALLQEWFSRLAGQDDFGIGLIHAGREHADFENVVGVFLNTFVLRSASRPPESFAARLTHVQEQFLTAHPYLGVPFDEVVGALQQTRDPARHPLVDVCYSAQDFFEHTAHWAGLDVAPVQVPSITSKFDVLVLATDLGRHVQLRFEYATDLFDHETIAHWVDCYQALLDAVLIDPDASRASLDWLPAKDRRDLMRRASTLSPALPSGTMVDLLAAEVEQRPDAIAVVAGNVTLTYAQLQAQADALARGLWARGVQTGASVAVCLPRDQRLIVALLGIWRAGAAYVPLDPSWPVARQHAICAGADIGLVVASPDHHLNLPAQVQLVTVEDLQQESNGATPIPSPEPIFPDQAAYVLFTSGSTGVPKAVEVPHRAVVRLVHAPSYVDITPDDRVPFLSSLSFDASTFEIWAPLAQGARLVVQSAAHVDLDEFAQFMARQRITTLWLTSALFNVVIDERPESLAHVRQVLIGGEALSAEHVRRARRTLPQLCIINGYGPTEVTTFACTYPIPDDVADIPDSVPIGRPIGHTEAYVVDANLQLVPSGIPGELLLGGAGVATGYRGRPDLTAERFVHLPFLPASHGTVYRSGDRVRWRRDGQLEFLGRLDRQLKVRGHRIEPAEIETVLTRHGRVRQAVVGVSSVKDALGTLWACVVPQGPANDSSALASELKQYLRDLLPAYLVPDRIVVTAALPRTSHGKLDLAALDVTDEASHDPRALLTPTQSRLMEILRELAPGLAISADDDFFVMGGHSLLAARWLARIHDEFQCAMSLASVFHHPTIAALARRIDGDSLATPSLQLQMITALDGYRLELRRVRKARGHSRGTVIGMPGVLGHAAEIGYLAQHVLLDFDILTFSLDTGGAYTLEPDGPSLRDPLRLQATVDAVVDMLCMPGAPQATAIIGFSLGGYLGWWVARRLSERGFSMLPVINLDGDVIDRFPQQASPHWASVAAGLRALPNEPPTPMLIVERADAGAHRLAMRRLSDAWRDEEVELYRIGVPTLDHLEVAVSPLLAEWSVDLSNFVTTGQIDTRPNVLSSAVTAPGAEAFRLLCGDAPRERLASRLREVLPADGTVRLGLLEAALHHGLVDEAYHYAGRIFAETPHERAAANVLVGIARARGDFKTAAQLIQDWRYGEPLPVGLVLSRRDASRPTPPPSESVTLGYRPSLNFAASDLRFPMRFQVESTLQEIRGWAWDPHAPNEAVWLDVMQDAQVLYSFEANGPIPAHLENVPDGLFGFSLSLSADWRPTISSPWRLRARVDGSEVIVPQPDDVII